MGLLITGPCKRCHLTRRLIEDNYCDLCYVRLIQENLYLRPVPKSFQMVPDVPTEEQALAAFTYCAMRVQTRELAEKHKLKL